MNMRKNIFSLFIVILLIATIYAPIPQTVYAQTQACHDATGMPIPCPGTGGSSNGGKPGKKDRPTQILPGPTSISTLVPVPTATLAGIPITGFGARPINSNNSLPAVQNPGQGSSPFTLPSPLGMIIVGLIIVVCFIGSLIIIVRKGLLIGFGDGSVRKVDPADQFIKGEDPSRQFIKFDGSDKMGAQPHMTNGSIGPGSTEASPNIGQPDSEPEIPPQPVGGHSLD